MDSKKFKLIHQSWYALHPLEDRPAPTKCASSGDSLTSSRFVRKLQLRATNKVVLIELATFEEGAVSAGAEGAGRDIVNFGLSWEDLEDRAGLLPLFAYEQYQVGADLLRLFAHMVKCKVEILEKLT